jgi:hypothetical protein
VPQSPPDPDQWIRARHRQLPPAPGSRDPDEWIRGQHERLAANPGAATTARDEAQAAPDPVQMPVESMRPGAFPAGGYRRRSVEELFRDMLGG